MTTKCLRLLLFVVPWLWLGGGLAQDAPAFPEELVKFTPFENNPVFTAGGQGQWDAALRERGWILKDGDTYRLWYTGYDGTREGLKMLGHATSKDGIHWQRHPQNPSYQKHWVEDVMVVKHEGTFFLFAEGKHDQAHLLESPDGLHWTRAGRLDVRHANGTPIKPGPYGTPTVWVENGTWYLFYERGDRGVWLATSRDRKVWTNVKDDPVLAPGPGAYDSQMIALNQIIQHNGRYYAYFHGSGDAMNPRLWSPAIASSPDLIHWTKYAGNPLRSPKENRSSGLVVPDGKGFRFYTMHGQVDLFLPIGAEKPGYSEEAGLLKTDLFLPKSSRSGAN